MAITNNNTGQPTFVLDPCIVHGRCEASISSVSSLAPSRFVGFIDDQRKAQYFFLICIYLVFLTKELHFLFKKQKTNYVFIVAEYSFLPFTIQSL